MYLRGSNLDFLYNKTGWAFAALVSNHDSCLPDAMSFIAITFFLMLMFKPARGQ